MKHSRCTRILVELGGDEKTVALSVTDNGIGMGPPSPKGAGMGLRIMQYRARTIGASLDIHRAPTGGTIVCCSLSRENC